MKLIDINNFVQTNITADSTSISADSTLITVDTIYTTNSAIFMLITPRTYADRVIINIKNELTEEVHIEENDTEIEGNYLKIFITNKEFKVGETYIMNVFTTDDKVIFISKVEVVENSNDNNFKLVKNNSNNKIIF